jgi:hypothetical protein
VRSPGWETRWADAEINWAEKHDEKVDAFCRQPK